MTETTNAENLQCKIRFSLVAEQILAFASSLNMDRDSKNLYPNSSKLRDDVLRY